MEEKIEVGYRNIGSITGKNYYHKFLLYTNKEGRERTISGWTGDASEALPYGRLSILADTPYNDANPDHPGSPNTAGQYIHRELITIGKDLSKTWENMTQDALMKDDRFPYDPLRQNSNTLADSVLRSAGLPEPKKDGLFGYWAPGSGNSLNESIIPAVPGLGNASQVISSDDNAAIPPQHEAALRANPRFHQALAALDKANHLAIFDNQQDKERIAAALALESTRGGTPLPGINEIKFTEENNRVFAVWNNPGNDLDVARVHIDRNQAVQQPLNATLEQLDQVTRQQEQALQNERQHEQMRTAPQLK